MKLRYLYAALALLVALPAAGNPLESLRQYFDNVQSLRGEFRQTVETPEGRVLEESAGSMAIQRPERFRWDYREPFEQHIIADGKRLWVYDVDLEQVTVRPLEQVLGLGPALLLSGNYQTLQETFSVEPGEGGWLRLIPKDPNWDFQAVHLKMADGVPRVLEVDDGMGQITRLELHDLEINPQLPAGLFQFDPPPSVDVVAPEGGG